MPTLIRSAYLVLIATAPTYAATVDVHLTDSLHDGPLADAAVCLGTPANPSQFGAQRTDTNGVASFEVAVESPLILTVSKPQFRGLQRPLPGKRVDRAVLVNLLRGGGGPTCPVPAASTATPRPAARRALAVTNCRINDGENRTDQEQVILRCRVTGEPTHHRVSERGDFAGADWEPYQPSVRVDLSSSRGSKTLHYQVRRLSSVAGASLQTISNVGTDNIFLNTH